MAEDNKMDQQSPTHDINSAQNNKVFQLMDALSLSGAIILMFFIITVVGIFQGNEKVWSMGGTALTTFVSGKRLGSYESTKKVE